MKTIQEWSGAFLAKQIWKLIGLYQVVLTIDGKKVADLPLLSVMENGKSGIYDDNWQLKIVSPDAKKR